MKQKLILTPPSYSKNSINDTKPFIDLYKEQFDVYVITDRYNEIIREIDDAFYVNKNSTYARYIEITADYVIDAGAVTSRTNYLKTQYRVSVWHGVPYKKMFTEMGSKFLPHALNYTRGYDMMVSPSSNYSKSFLNEAMLYSGEILEVGSARCDNLYISEERKAELKEELGIDGKKFVLYAPTLRDENDICKLNTDLIKENIGEDCVIGIKGHYLNTNFLSGQDCIDLGSFENISELLSICDLFITDYSSTMFDYSLLNKPMILWQYDFKKYEIERGLRFDIKKYLDPKYVARNDEELIAALQDYQNADCSALKSEFYPMEEGNSAERIKEALNLSAKNKEYSELIFVTKYAIDEANNKYASKLKYLKEKYNTNLILIADKSISENVESNLEIHSDFFDGILTFEKDHENINAVIENTNGLILVDSADTYLKIDKVSAEAQVVLIEDKKKQGRKTTFKAHNFVNRLLSHNDFAYNPFGLDYDFNFRNETNYTEDLIVILDPTNRKQLGMYQQFIAENSSYFTLLVEQKNVDAKEYINEYVKNVVNISRFKEFGAKQVICFSESCLNVLYHYIDNESQIYFASNSHPYSYIIDAGLAHALNSDEKNEAQYEQFKKEHDLATILSNIVIESEDNQIRSYDMYLSNKVKKKNSPTIGKLSKTPLVSIIIPFYNNHETIVPCLESVFAQKYTNIEVIVINDGSTEIPKNIKKNYPNVEFLYHENVGLGMTRNRGIKQSSGKYIFFLDSDDTIPKMGIRRLVAMAENNNLDVVSGKCLRSYVDDNRKETVWASKLYEQTAINSKNERQKMYIDTIATNKIYNREFLKENGIWFETGLFEDKLFINKIYLKAERIGIIDKFVYTWMVYGNQTSITTSFNLENFTERMKRVVQIWDMLPEIGKYYNITFVLNHDFRVYYDNYLKYKNHERLEMFNAMRDFVINNEKYILISEFKNPVNKNVVTTFLNNDFETFNQICTINFQNTRRMYENKFIDRKYDSNNNLLLEYTYNYNADNHVIKKITKMYHEGKKQKFIINTYTNRLIETSTIIFFDQQNNVEQTDEVSYVDAKRSSLTRSTFVNKVLTKKEIFTYDIESKFVKTKITEFYKDGILIKKIKNVY